ncbi:MAG: HD domain-containing protein [Muribaculaceae bacterium]|nr:HD domain-containing protein [Muribaculaceae bacterium]
MIDTHSIIYRFYEPGSDLCDLLIKHSTQVAELSKQFSQRLIDNHVPVDIDFVEEAAMLHDIGIIHTDAPGIYCHGNEPYIRHGVLGRAMLDEIGLFRHAMVCERHTGTGLSLRDIEARDLPLPHRDLLPLSIEEKIVCYADKFFSKSHPDAPRSVEVARGKLLKFGEETIARFDEMRALFGEPDYSKL